MSQQLQYIYAQIEVSTGRCFDVFTCTYEIPIPDEYILIPEFTYDYNNKYYNSADQKWYHDPSFESEWLEAPQW
jgi:hypothetical protein